MNTNFRSLWVYGLFVMALCTSSIAIAEPALDVAYAETMPLASKSLLLDITKAGDVLVAVGVRGHVLTSTDGQNWTQAEHVPTRSTLTTVFAIGNRLWAAGHDAVIITSGDAGKTWTLQNFDPEAQQAFMDIVFTDEDNGMAIGSYGLYLQTQDGGQTWDYGSVDPDNEFHLNSMVVFDDNRLMIAGEAGYSYRSEDGGETWEALDLPYQGSMWGAIQTLNGCVLFYGLRGHALESCDFGTEWTELDTGTNASISGAAINDKTLMLAANRGVVIMREQGGPFVVQQHSSGVDFAAALANGPGSFLLVGEDGAHQYPENNVTGGQE